MVGQFKTVASADTGLVMAAIAAGTVLVALYFHRRAYKPLFESKVSGDRRRMSKMEMQCACGCESDDSNVVEAKREEAMVA